jgi:hypothetical protein
MSIAVETSEPFSEIERGGPQARKSTKPQDHGGGDSSRKTLDIARANEPMLVPHQGCPSGAGPAVTSAAGSLRIACPPAARMMARSGSPSNRCSVVRRRVTQGAHPARAGREPGRLRKGRHAGSPRARRTALPRGFAAPGAESTRRAVRAGLWSHSRYRMGAGAGERYICFSCVPTVHRIRTCILASMTFECNRNHCLAAGLA